jgi:hypothetical protein
LPGRTVYLDTNNDGHLSNGELSTVTSANGAYAFPNLIVGAYTVRLEIPFTNVIQTGPSGNAYVVTLMGADATGRDFGQVIFGPVAPVSVSKDLYGPLTNPTPDAAFIQGLYHTVLGRAGDAEGIAHWLTKLASGQTLAEVAYAFVISVEHRIHEVDAYYKTFLHRAADAEGRTFWLNLFRAGADEAAVVVGFLNSLEYQNAHVEDGDFVRDLYVDVLGRNGAKAELDGWLTELAKGKSRRALASFFVYSDESYQLAVIGFYSAYLHRANDIGFLSWANELAAGNSVGLVEVHILGEPFFREFYTNGEAKAT